MVRDVGAMSRTAVLTDAHWERISALMPSCDGKRGRRFRDHRQVVEGIVYRYRTGIAWRDLPAEFGPWQTVWKRHHRFSQDGTWDAIHAALLAEADAAGVIDWSVSVDSTINRAHQHGTSLPRDTGGPGELHESARRTA
jgi:transposase